MTYTPTISLCMIVRNEEATIGRCLNSVQHLVDEIIIVDTGSTDETIKIVQTYTDKVYHFAWIDDFAAARNFSFSKATMDYILWLDADDVLLTDDQRKFQKLKDSFPADVDAFLMDYHINHDRDGKVTFSTIRTRLVRRSKGFCWYGRVHETLEDAATERAYVTITVTHRKNRTATARNIKIYEKMLECGEHLSPRDMFHYALECLHHQRLAAAIQWFEAYLAEDVQDVEFRSLACGHLADCYYRMGNKDQCLQTCLQAFTHHKPRPEITGRLSNLFIEMKNYETARFWAELSLTLSPQPGTVLSVDHMYTTWLPHIQLAECYIHLNNSEAAKAHLEKALTYSPSEPTVQAYCKRLTALQTNKQEST